MDRLKWERNYDGLDDEDMREDTEYKRFLTHVCLFNETDKYNPSEIFFADVEGEDELLVEAFVWSKSSDYDMVTKEFATFDSAKAWARRELEKRYKRGF